MLPNRTLLFRDVESDELNVPVVVDAKTDQFFFDSIWLRVCKTHSMSKLEAQGMHLRGRRSEKSAVFLDFLEVAVSPALASEE